MTVKECIDRIDFLTNRHDHGLLNDDQFNGELLKTTEELLELLRPSKEKRGESGFETKKEEPKKEEPKHHQGKK